MWSNPHTAAAFPPQGLRQLYADTLAALLAPRRALPLAVVAIPLVVAQFAFSDVKGPATALALGELAVFVLVAPFAWRALFPMDRPAGLWPLRLAAYALLGALPRLGVRRRGGVVAAFGVAFNKSFNNNHSIIQ